MYVQSCMYYSDINVIFISFLIFLLKVEKIPNLLFDKYNETVSASYI